jgi:hypothetical protein
MVNYNESGEFGETLKSGSPQPTTDLISLTKAIEFGEYDPQYLANFPEWHKLTPHGQFELIKQALDNRNRQLIKQWADINNVLDFSKKPHLQTALRNIEANLKFLEQERERLFLEYSHV